MNSAHGRRDLARRALDLVALVQYGQVEMLARPHALESWRLDHFVRGDNHVVRAHVLDRQRVRGRGVQSQKLERRRPLCNLVAPRVENRQGTNNQSWSSHIVGFFKVTDKCNRLQSLAEAHFSEKG